MRFGTGIGPSKPSGNALTYIKDGLKLYMPYKGADTTKGTQFVGTGSTSFDGDNDYIDIGTPSQLDVGDVVTMSAWIKSNDTSAYKWIYQYGEHASTKDRALVIDSNDKAVFYVYGTNATSTTSVTDGKWHHLVGTLDGVSSKIYVDGVLEDTETPTLANYTYSSVLIGKNNAGSYHFEGSIKNVAVWSRALTATEVQNVMYKTYPEVSGRLASGLVSWWALDATQVDETNLFDIDGDWGVDETSHAWIGYGGGTFDASVLGEFKVIAGTTSYFEMGGYLYTNSGTMENLWIAGGNYRLVATTSSSISSETSGLEFYDDGDVTQFNNGDISYDFVLGTTSSSFFRFHDMAQLEEITISNWKMYKLNCEDLKGSNDGITYGATIDTDLYGGDTPVIPRAIDNAPTVQADAIGSGSASFDGSTDYISIADDSSLDITSDFSITCWVKFDSFDSNEDGIISKTDNSAGDGYGLYMDTADDKVKFFSKNYNSDYAETGALSVNTWYHIAGTYSDSGNLNSIYVDGVLTDTSAESTAMVADSEPLEIGRIFQHNNSNLNGNICQVGIWQGALTQETIQSVMEKTYEELTATEKSSLGADVYTNAGGSGQTDWVDTDGIADGWEEIYGAPGVSTTIVTGNGFTGNAQRLDGNATTYRAVKKSGTPLDNATLYKYSFQYRCDQDGGTIDVRNGTSDVGIPSLTTNTGSPITVTGNFVSVNTAGIVFRIHTDAGANAFIEIDSVSLKPVTHDLVSYWALDEQTGTDGEAGTGGVKDSHGSNHGTMYDS